jgi:mRNA interferase MazF
VKRGEVRSYKFSPPDKHKPVLILTRDSVIEYLGEVTVAPITTTIRDIPSEVVLGRQDGLSHDCAVNCDHIQTVAKAKNGSMITRWNDQRMAEVKYATAFALGLAD